MERANPRRCHVCTVVMMGAHLHHAVPRSDGGADGPVVPLCPACHGAVHGAVTRMVAGRAPDASLAHLTEDARERAAILVQVALAAHRSGVDNPHPTLHVTLDSPDHVRALDLWRADRGFSSREAAINAILREIGAHYDLFAAPTARAGRATISIADLRRTGHPPRDEVG